MSEINITIIDIDLGQSIESIIQDNITEITTKNRQTIDEAIKEANIQQEADNAIKATKEKQSKDKEELMTRIYNELLASNSFLPSSYILSIVSPEMPNMISFVGRMRNWLKTNNHQYKLTPVKKNKEQGYKLDPINNYVAS